MDPERSLPTVCAEHTVALAADGSCVRCRHAESRRATRGLFLGLGAVFAAVTLVGTLSLAARKGASAEAESARAAGPTVARDRPTFDTTRPQAEQIQAETKNVSIRVYTAAWCGACKAAKRWMKANDVAFQEIDVDKDPGADAALRKLRSNSLPTFDVEGQVSKGFSERWLRDAMTKAAAKHFEET